VNLKLSPDEMKTLDDRSPHAGYYPSWFNASLADQAMAKALGAP
jgi:hypothetical protein